MKQQKRGGENGLTSHVELGGDVDPLGAQVVHHVLVGVVVVEEP